MKKSNRNLVLVLAVVYLSFALMLWKYFNATTSEVITIIVFGLVITVLAMIGLIKMGDREEEKANAYPSSLPTRYWVVLVSFVFAFVGGLMMLVALIPFVGYQVFDLLIERWQLWWLGLVLATVILYPIVNKRFFKPADS